ncbi:MAG TPA: aspartate carbamoyltransferase catalytic subunit [Acidimicrobiia bacterium]|nr:aspartate carbamoyltransferase catalytic subunit [Acidimicrobiia bacterium]
MKHLLGIADLDRAEIEGILDLAESFLEVTQREIAKVPALRGRTVASVFYEDSTRTRLSFEGAAKRLSADTLTFTPKASSVSKGESLRDTVQTIEAMGADAMVVRHPSAGAPHRVADWVDASVVNAGDGWHEHPTQALIDTFTLRRHRGASLDGLRVGIVGDVAHSRVARSNVAAMTALGASVTLVGPPTLMPPNLDGWPVTVADDLDAVLADLDVVSLLRIQRERQEQSLFPSLREYTARWGLTAERAARLRSDVLVMHPGPMNRGVEIADAVADSPASLVTEQVANGVAVRMAVLYQLLGSGAASGGAPANGTGSEA